MSKSHSSPTQLEPKTEERWIIPPAVRMRIDGLPHPERLAVIEEAKRRGEISPVQVPLSELRQQVPLSFLTPEEAAILTRYATLRRQAEVCEEEADQIEPEAFEIIDRLPQWPRCPVTGNPENLELLIDPNTSAIELLVSPSEEEMEAKCHVITFCP